MPSSPTLPPLIAAAAAALAAGDVEGWCAIYAPDAVHEFPFAAAGAPRRLVGRDAITAFMRELPELIRFGPLTDITARDLGDELVIEATGHHRRRADDRTVTLDYVWFITVRDGLVVRFRDYMNPEQLASL